MGHLCAGNLFPLEEVVLEARTLRTREHYLSCLAGNQMSVLPLAAKRPAILHAFRDWLECFLTERASPDALHAIIQVCRRPNFPASCTNKYELGTGLSIMPCGIWLPRAHSSAFQMLVSGLLIESPRSLAVLVISRMSEPNQQDQHSGSILPCSWHLSATPIWLLIVRPGT